MWVAWFKSEILQGSLSNFWIVKPSAKNSWLVNKLIKLRREVFTWIRMSVGNGQSCRFWTDNWSPYGALEEYILGGRNTRQGIGPSANLSDLCRNGVWLLPAPRSEEMLSLQIHLTTFQLTGEEDKYEWIIDGKKEVSYNTSKIYCKLMGEEQSVPWEKAVWIKGGILKQSFLTWLFVLNRCPTRDRLLNWGLNTDPSCLLCNLQPESRNHIFFSVNSHG